MPTSETKINWFPGHMAKALRMIEENLALADAVGYVLDARAPAACINPALDTLISDKGVVFILNKKDLSEEKAVRAWEEYFSEKGGVASVNAAAGLNIAAVKAAFENTEKKRVSRFEKKGIYTPVRVMIIGVPNSGKSTLINALAGKKSAVTGDKPGVTKGKQWVRLSKGLELMDTPGTLWGKLENPLYARHLAYIGSVRDEVVDMTELAADFLEEMAEKSPERLRERYKTELQQKGADMLESICRARGCMLKGGEPDLERGAKSIIEDFRKGRLGKICLEMPDERT